MALGNENILITFDKFSIILSLKKIQNFNFLNFFKIFALKFSCNYCPYNLEPCCVLVNWFSQSSFHTLHKVVDSPVLVKPKRYNSSAFQSASIGCIYVSVKKRGSVSFAMNSHEIAKLLFHVFYYFGAGIFVRLHQYWGHPIATGILQE